MGPGREFRDEAHEQDVEPTAWRAVAYGEPVKLVFGLYCILALLTQFLALLVSYFLARSPSFKVGELPHYAKFLPTPALDRDSTNTYK